jgi:two-component system, LytTR family, response regulator
MLRVLLVDDEAPARDRLRRLLGAHADVECIGEAGNGLEALEKIAALAPDLVFLDIQMPELDGLAVAAAIPKSGPSVVFATAFDQHAIRAFELAAVDYLLKPIAKDRLAQALERARGSGARAPAIDVARAVLATLRPKSRKMAVRSGAKYVVFDTERIAAILARDHYSMILVDDRELLSDDPLDKLMDQLDDAQFLRVHRGAILNVGFVHELQKEGDRKYVALLADAACTQVPISREKLDELKARLGIP